MQVAIVYEWNIDALPDGSVGYFEIGAPRLYGGAIIN